MSGKMGKYFLAIVPDEAICDEVTILKEQLRDSFGLKYALRSPPHITLKMPFVHNEKKEGELIKALEAYINNIKSFPLIIRGVGSFGSRVAFLKLRYPPELKVFQHGLVDFFKRRLKKNLELSDTNYYPHLTVAFKDFKKGQFEDVMAFVKDAKVKQSLQVHQVSLLKKVDGRWLRIADFQLTN
ncbi:Phosphoesterase HXTX [Cyclobacterium marinum DSM 745]|uniref:Phosphoesterase HXTX n=2 Tax=Cyclobacterium marinum TaxID=104 RepID=G0J608_CYCMS|nr:Phosphoesterase HXTX [Cyclobacterium marinum DSM 745]